MPTLDILLFLSSLLPSTTYGYGELRCGDIGQPVACDGNAVTASGEAFDPTKPQVAIAAPLRLVLKAKWVGLKVEGGKCKWVRLTDKMNPRYVGVRGFDLTPAAVRLLTGKDGGKYWSGRVEVCKINIH